MRIVFVTNRVKKYALSFKLVIELLIELGHEVIWAADFSRFKEDISIIPCEIYQVDFRSNPLNLNNIRAYKKLIKLFNTKSIDGIHCNTPIGGLIGRLCAKKANIKTVIYTAHGFHFYKGAPFLNRTLFKWGERFLAHYTDILITINKEDYEAAKCFKLRNNGKVMKIHGAGICTGFTSAVDHKEMRRKIGVPQDVTMIFSAGEINRNKNNEVIIKAISKINDHKIYYVLCGEGDLQKKLKCMASDLKISDRVIFLGFRRDVLDILPAADIFVMPSLREGLPRSLMEAMDAGLPCVISKIRGNVDLIEEGEGGYLINPGDITAYAEAIRKLDENKALRERFGAVNKEKVKAFDFYNIKNELKEIYINCFT